jgi:hypothetical protein
MTFLHINQEVKKIKIIKKSRPFHIKLTNVLIDNFLASAAVYENFYQQPVNTGLYGALPQYAYTQGRQMYNDDSKSITNVEDS